MVRFSKHAREQMRERGLTEDEVVRVLSGPAETVTTRANRLASYSALQGKHIVVIHEKENDEHVVLTAMKVDRRRLARYGFTQV